MNHHKLIRNLVAGLISFVWGGTLAFAEAPNVLLITADDMNWDSLGCFGNDLAGVTPNLDRLASQGVRFEQAYVTIAICQPCRASIMTARYPHNSGALGFDKINDGVPTLPERLMDNGYYTACIGKARHTVPGRHATAFDEAYYMMDLGYGRSPRRYRETTSGAISQAAKQGKPFFLNVNLHDPHRPFANAPQENRAKKPESWVGVPLVESPYQPEDIHVPEFLPDLPEIRIEIAEYSTSVRRCDQIVGEVLKVLDESGEADDTLVLFLSDHGIAVPFAKTNCWMHSNRTPLIVRWPGKTVAGQVVRQEMVNSIDLAPTILDAVGLENLAGADGQSFRSLWGAANESQKTGFKNAGRDHVFVHLNAPFSRRPFPMRGVITPTHGYIWNGWAGGKSTFSNESMSGRTFAAMKAAAKSDSQIAARVELYLHRVPEEFYNYSTDPNALRNQLPEQADAPAVEIARRRLLRHMQQTDDPQLQAYSEFLKQNDWRSPKPGEAPVTAP